MRSDDFPRWNAILTAIFVPIAASCSHTFSNENSNKNEVRVIQHPSSATGAVYIQVVTSSHEAPPPVIEASLDCSDLLAIGGGMTRDSPKSSGRRISIFGRNPIGLTPAGQT